MKKRDLIIVLVACAALVAVWPRPKPPEPEQQYYPTKQAGPNRPEDLAKGSTQPGYKLVSTMKWPTAMIGQRELELGKQLFGTNCASCHGPNGVGDGPAGLALDPKPTNLTLQGNYKYGCGVKSVFRSIKYGIEGTGAAPWEGRMTDDEILATSEFLWTIVKD